VQVLATPQMVLLMERAGVAAVDHLLPEGYLTVGAHLDVRHLEPTPLGYEVEAVAEVVEVDGRRLTFRVQVREESFDAAPDRPFDAAPDRPFDAAPDRPFDAAPDRPFDAAPDQPVSGARGSGVLVGEGTHQRIVIDVQGFRERVAQKAK
jgi:predicted thioesterase